MAIDFPGSPSTGQRHSHNNTTWEWDGSSWNRITIDLSTTDAATLSGIAATQFARRDDDNIITGVTTFIGNGYTGVGNTVLIVEGDARVTGVLSVGQGSVSINERDIYAVGVVTGSNFKTGTTNVHNVGIEAAGINVLGADTPIGAGATVYNSGLIVSKSGAEYQGVVTASSFVGDITGNVTGNVSGSSGSSTGNAATAGKLQTARTIGGVSFDGGANINLPGVNIAGNQNTTGTAALAEGLTGTPDITVRNVTVTGIQTAEDVKNIDSIGIITARTGIDVTGGTFKADGLVGAAGSVLSSTGSGINWVSPQTGPQGAAGAQGAVGAQGAAGVAGAQGAQGHQGRQGAAGAAGAQGVTGAQGHQGVQGTTGNTGAQGVQGAQGRQGAQGAQGVQGAAGAQGNQGVQGAAGAAGAQGAQGAQGHQGVQGSVGIASLTISTSAPSSPAQGDMWWDSDDATLGLYYNDGNSSQWVNINHGPAGAQGAQGVQGAQGHQGVQGAQGHQGVQGAAGAQGATGAQGHQGVQGAGGSTGAAGAQGAQGAQGVQGAAATIATGDTYVKLRSTSAASNTGTNTFAGSGAGAALNGSSGDHNTFYGRAAGAANDTGQNNVFLGSNAGVSNVNGHENVAIGQAAYENGTGTKNIAIGRRALQATTSSDSSVGIGYEALKTQTNGGQSVAIGHEAAMTVETGSQNVAIGHAALKLGTAGSNTIVGAFAGDAITSGEGNVALGRASLSALQTGHNNIAIGRGASASSTSVSNEITLGDGNITKFRIPGIGLTVTSLETQYGGGLVVAGISSFSDVLKFPTNVTSTPSASGNVHIYRHDNQLKMCGGSGIRFDEGGFSRWWITSGALHPHGTTYNNLGNSTNRVGNAYIQTSVDLVDDAELRLGNSDDMKIYYKSSSSENRIEISNGNFFIDAVTQNEIMFTHDSKYMLRMTPDNLVRLYYDGNVRFETSNTGATVNGTLTVSGNNTSSFAGNMHLLKASGQASFIIGSGNAGGSYLILDGDSNGDSSGSDYSYLAHNTDGDILLVADNPSNNGSIFLKSNGGSYQAIACHENGKVEIRYQNTKKFETTSDGVTISGTGSLLVPSGTTAQRPSGSNGMMRHNSTTGAIEGYAGGAWQVIVGTKGTQGNPYTSVADAQSDNASEGLHYFKNSTNQVQELYYDNSDSGWILVASNHAAYSTIPAGNNRRSLSYTLHRNGTLGHLGTANPSQDYIIGDWYSNFSFSRCRIIGYGRNSTSHSYTWTNKGGWVNAQWDTTSRNTITHTNNVTWTSSGGWSKHGSSTYWSIDGIWSDYNNNNSWNANTNQTTVGGVGVAQSHGSPEGGCYMGHGNSEGNYEGWYDSGGSNMDSSGYTTWLR
tara:strand:- start:1413 stop:5492 length:4080 start_codon:yes stop_codon:yes gene_type:complete